MFSLNLQVTDVISCLSTLRVWLSVSQISPPLQTVTGDLTSADSTSEPTAAPQICQRGHLRDGMGGGGHKTQKKEKKMMTTMMAERRPDHREFALTCTSAHPWPTSRGWGGGRGSPRGHGVPKPSSIPPPHTQRRPVTSLLKHRSKSPDWSQRLRNK